MYLSRVEINPFRRETIRAFSSPQIIHAAVMASFPSFGSNPGRVMWRIDKVGSSTYLIVQSSIKPDFNHIIDQFGRPESERKWDVMDYDTFLSGLENGQIWRFRLKVNPTYSLSQADGKRGKIVAHVTAEQQISWMISKAKKYGFDILDETIVLKHRDVKTFDRDKQKITLSTATFEGVLQIKDVEAIRHSIINGIGRGKAYGCGLLSLARV